MKIVTIFEEQLFSFVYKDRDGCYLDNEYDRLISLWTDLEYLRDYAIENNIANVDEFVDDRLEDAEDIQELIEEIGEGKAPLEAYFTALHNSEIGVRILSLQKGKSSRRDGLRIYAIKVDKITL